MSRFDLNRLATYNAEVARGLVHTDAWKQEMIALQAEFEAELNRARNRGDDDLIARIDAFMAVHDPKPYWWPGK